MLRFKTIAGGLAAAALLTAAAAMAQPAQDQPAHDPMNALRDGPAYDARSPSGVPVEVEAAPQQVAAIPDPMATAGQSPTAAAAEPAALAKGAPNPDLGDLPDGPGAEDTYYTCVACHSTAIIRQQRVTDVRWDYLWNWMIEAQGMIEPDAETKVVILGYLKEHFSSER